MITELVCVWVTLHECVSRLFFHTFVTVLFNIPGGSSQISAWGMFGRSVDGVDAFSVFCCLGDSVLALNGRFNVRLYIICAVQLGGRTNVSALWEGLLRTQLRIAFSALTLMVWHQEEHPACKSKIEEWWGAGVVVYLKQGANDLHMVQRCQCQPIISCFIKIQDGLTFLVPAYPRCPRKDAIKQVEDQTPVYCGKKC